jgi:carbon storage regulator
MLVLSRRADERIQIGADITVTVVRIADGVVRLGIEAPGHVTIVRSEVQVRQEEGPSERRGPEVWH